MNGSDRVTLIMNPLFHSGSSVRKMRSSYNNRQTGAEEGPVC